MRVKNNDTVVMPAHVRPGQIMGLVEATGGLGSPIDLSRVADELGADIATLLPMLDAAEMLGLVKVERGVVALTEFGSRFQKASKNKMRLVKEQLAKIEPFNTALVLGAHRHAFSSGEVAKTLSKKGVRWHHEPEVNEAVVRGLLIHWTIYAGLLQYDGKADKFRKASTTTH
jgi:NitT/TauT family transport system ATP-binding protein